MEVYPVILEGQHVRLEPLSLAHEEALIAAAGDGELWNSTVTIVPSRETIGSYIGAALNAQAQGHALPFVIIRKASGVVVGCTRFFHIERDHRRVEIGYTWLSSSAQRTSINTEAKLLLLSHAFELWRCIRVEFFTDFLNHERDEFVGLRRYERYVGSDDDDDDDKSNRPDYRNGYYERDWVTRFGTIRLRIARTRGKTFLPTGLRRFQRRADEVGILIREAFLRDQHKAGRTCGGPGDRRSR